MLSIQNLTFAYSRRKPPVIRDFSLSIARGGIYGLLGRNGAGKSTLLYLIAGALTPRSGKVLYDDIDTRRRLPQTLSEIFIVPEEFNLPPVSFSEFVKRNAPFYPRFSMDDLQRHTEIFDLSLTDNLGALSMGQKKKAYMSFALATNTSLLIMDEPTNGLDIPGKSSFRRLIASAMTDDRTVLISTHQVRDIERLLDHVIIMDNHGVLLNKSVYDITERLTFKVTDSPDVVARALYSQPGVGGTNVVLINDSGDETPVNLETLFEFSLSNPQKLSEIYESR